MSLPLVAIVGAPNVGKSTLFNRLVGRRQALVTDRPGMTRDRLYGVVDDSGRRYRIVDTGGMTPKTEAPFARPIERQAGVAIEESVAVMFVVDGRAGLSGSELEIAEQLRRADRPVLLLANKVDNLDQTLALGELHRLGLGEPLLISAEHGLGIDELLDALAGLLPEPAAGSDIDDDDGEIKLAIVGRPNVGKSSLLNRLVGEERVMVSDVPGTTRDAIDTLFDYEGRRFRLIDTAGLRRPGRVHETPEHISVVRARDSIARADVALVVLDADAGFAAQDAHIAGHVVDAYRPMIVAVNKWDLIEDREEQARRWEEQVSHRLRFAKGVPMVLISALSGQRVLRLLQAACEVYDAAGTRVPTQELNRWLQGQEGGDPTSPPPRGQFRIYYATQSGVRPPTFILFCNDPDRAHFSIRRQLANSLRARFDLGSVPIRLQLRRRRGSRE